VRSTTRCSLKRTLNHGEEAAEHLRERSSSAKRDRLLWGKTGRSMMGLSSGDEDGHVGSPEQTLSHFWRKTGLDERNHGVSGAEPAIGPEDWLPV